MSSVKKDNINKHFHSLPDCYAPHGLETCARWAGPAATPQQGWGAGGPWLAQIESIPSQEGGAPDFRGDHTKKEKKKKNPQPKNLKKQKRVTKTHTTRQFRKNKNPWLMVNSKI